MQRIEVTVELNDETTHDLVIANPSLVAWDRTRATRQWPKTEDAPLLWMTFIAWHHMKAHGLVKCDYTEFEEKVCVQVSGGEDDDVDVDPTQPAAEPVSSSS